MERKITKKTKGWGGKRDGSGRHKAKKQKIPKMFNLSMDAAEFIDDISKGWNCSKSFLIEEMIMRLSNKKTWIKDEGSRKRVNISEANIQYDKIRENSGWRRKNWRSYSPKVRANKIRIVFNLSMDAAGLIDDIAKKWDCTKSFLIEVMIMRLSKATWKEYEFSEKRVNIPRVYIVFDKIEKKSSVYIDVVGERRSDFCDFWKLHSS